MQNSNGAKFHQNNFYGFYRMMLNLLKMLFWSDYLKFIMVVLTAHFSRNVVIAKRKNSNVLLKKKNLSSYAQQSSFYRFLYILFFVQEQISL
jgi:hypothetical protein